MVIPNYQGTFNNAVEKDAVVLGDVDIDVIDDEQRKIEEERMLMAKKDAEEFEKQRIQMMKLQEETKTDLFHRSKILAKELEQTEMDAILRARERRAQLNKTFMKLEAGLETKIKGADGVMETEYNKLILNSDDTNKNLISDAKERNFKVKWRSTPQKLYIRVECCRCLRDKIGNGHYFIRCSVRDQICGNVLDYQDRDRRVEWKASTDIKAHDGNYKTETLLFGEGITLYAPSKYISRPSMVLLFELIMAKSETCTEEATLGWAVFPLLNQQLQLNIGYYKVDSYYIS